MIRIDGWLNRYREWVGNHFRWVLALFVIFIVAQVLTGTDARLPAAACYLAALVLWFGLVDAAYRGELPTRPLLVALGISVVAMVAIAPATSSDFNSYSLYGRMVAEYGVSPYVFEPRDFAADAWYPRISYYWTDAPSVYGPVFTVISAAVMSVAGTSALGARIGFGLVAASALLLTVALAATRLGKARAALLIGINPLILTFGVNDVHADVLVGMFVLAGALAVARKRVVLAAIALCAGALVKISVLPALAGVAAWLWFNGDKRRAAIFSAACAVFLVLPILAAGGVDVLAPLLDAANGHTRFSLWNPIYDLWDSPIVGKLATLVVAVGVVYAIWRHRRDPTPFVVVAVGLVAYQLLGAYVLSWYAVWSVPVLALAWRESRAGGIALLHGSWVALAYFSGWLAFVIAAVVGVWFLVRTLHNRSVSSTGLTGR